MFKIVYKISLYFNKILGKVTVFLDKTQENASLWMSLIKQFSCKQKKKRLKILLF